MEWWVIQQTVTLFNQQQQSTALPLTTSIQLFLQCRHQQRHLTPSRRSSDIRLLLFLHLTSQLLLLISRQSSCNQTISRCIFHLLLNHHFHFTIKPASNATTNFHGNNLRFEIFFLFSCLIFFLFVAITCWRQLRDLSKLDLKRTCFSHVIYCLI